MFNSRKLSKLYYFVKRADSSLPPLVVNSIPKAGTNLVERIVIELGYRRAWSRCVHEHNLDNVGFSPTGGRLYVAHLAENLSCRLPEFRILNIRRNLYDCIRSYINYMYIDTRHGASKFVRSDFGSERVDALLFSSQNPLGRPLIDEYLRYYRPGVFERQNTLDYDALIRQEATAVACVGRVLSLDQERVSASLSLSLDAPTSTRNSGQVRMFSSLPSEYRTELKKKLDCLEQEAS